MILLNIKLAFRNLIKNKFFSILNILGLSSGIAVSVLVFMWVADELSFDKQHKNLDNIFFAISNQTYDNGNEVHTKCTPFPLKDALQKNYPEVETVCRFTEWGNFPVGNGDKKFVTDMIVAADPEFTDIFTLELIEGDINCLNNCENIIITKKVANTFFGNKSALGQPLLINSIKEFTVGAVVADNPKNTTLDFNIIMPIIQLTKLFGADFSNWYGNWPSTIVLIKPNSNVTILSQSIKNLNKENGSENIELSLKPLKNDRLYTNNGIGYRLQYIYLFIGIGIIILLIACINFVNISTAKTQKRAVEVGIRKVNGAEKRNIVMQFLTEKVVIIFICMCVSLIMAYSAIPLFNQISGKSITFTEVFDLKFSLGFLAIGIATTIFASVYPSLYMSSFSAMRALKPLGSLTKSKKISFRNILVIIQFSLSVALIICTIVINSQLKHLMNTNLGYDKENLIYVELNGASTMKDEVLIQELNKLPQIVNCTKADKGPFLGGNNTGGFDWEGKDPKSSVLISITQVDNNYLQTLGIKLAEGNNFSNIDYFKDDVQEYEVILNQEAIRQMQLKDPIGKSFGFGWKGRIIGIVEDYHFESLHSKIEPLVLIPITTNAPILIVRLQKGNIHSTLEKVKEVWQNINPQEPLTTGFFNDKLNSMYTSEKRISNLFSSFSFIAIFISCLGLLGLSAFAAEQRTKEIGIRKVNGASVYNILFMLNKSFIQLVFISIIIGIPLAYLFMEKWLQKFAYKTEMSWLMFVAAALTALIIAVITVSWQSVKSAMQNPVKSLKYE